MFSICFPMDTSRLPQFKVTKLAYDKMPQKKEFVIATRSEKEVWKYLKENKLGKGVRLIPYTIETGFNPSKGLNIAVKCSKYDNIIITSPEVCPEPDVLDKFEASLGTNIICEVFDQYEDGTLFSLVHRGFRDASPEMYFLALYNKKDIEKINGWDEDFMKGYACEDNDFGERWVRAGLPWELREDIHATHQWHPRGVTIENGFQINIDKIQENRANALVVCKNGMYKL